LLIKGEYADGEKNGIWIYTVGDHREEGNYIIGLRDGVWKYFDNEENLLYKGNYVQDNPDGYHTYFWENGRVKEEQYYSMGIMQRTWKKYDDEGAVLMTISYKDGVERRINGIKVNLPESEVKLIK
jgi:antitoxin component YwqK of YwqJK toxin-antitoxin module